LSRIEQQILPSRYIIYSKEKKRLSGEFNISSSQGGIAMSFGIYLVGYIILIAGLAIGANLLHVPMQWIGVGILCLIGMAIVHGVTATRQKDTQS
jgi:hypothetical protein